METKKTSTGSNKPYIAIIAILLLLTSFTFYQLFSERNKKDDVTAQKTELESQFHNLSDSLAIRSDQLESFKGKNAELDRAIADKQAQIDREKKTIQNLFAKTKLTQAELSEARDRIAEYQVSLSDMSAKIEELNKKNTELTAQNGQLNSDLNSERGTTAKLTEQNKGLAQKVQIGSLLSIPKLDVEAVKKRFNGKEATVRRAKAAESLKISFETGENKVIDPGQVSLYVRIINPKGETISVSDQGSGTLTSAEKPEPVQFTKKADFDYDQSNKKVVVYWSQNIKDPGVYKVELYQNGYVVGQGQVKLS